MIVLKMHFQVGGGVEVRPVAYGTFEQMWHFCVAARSLIVVLEKRFQLPLVVLFDLVVVVFGTLGTADVAISAAVTLIVLRLVGVCTHMSMHVTVGGERVAAVLAVERTLTAVHQHVPVQAGTGAQHLLADPAGETLLVVLQLHLVVVGTYVQGELVLRGQHCLANWAHVLPFGTAAVAPVVAVAILRVGGVVYGRVGGGEDTGITSCALVVEFFFGEVVWFGYFHVCNKKTNKFRLMLEQERCQLFGNIHNHVYCKQTNLYHRKYKLIRLRNNFWCMNDCLHQFYP